MESWRPAWKATSGYSINEEKGNAEKCSDRACTLHFYLAEPGDTLQLLDSDYEYAVATYRLGIDSRYIYTYDYQAEENWTEYCHDFVPEKFTRKSYRFRERVYFRIVLKKVSSGEEERLAEQSNKQNPEELFRKDFSGNESFGLAGILKWQKGAGQDRHVPGNGISEGADGKDLREIPREEPQKSQRTEAWKRKIPLENPLQAGIKKEIEETVCSVGEKQTSDSLNFLLMTDNHYTVNGTWQDTIGYMEEVVHGLEKRGVMLDGFLHLGDATDGMVPAEVTRDYVAGMQQDIQRLGIPLCYVIGNHDSNYFRNNPERFSREEVREIYLKGREKCYYYQDYPDRHLRMIFLESFDPEEKVRYGFAEEELDWLEKLLAHTSADWYVLVFSHVPPTPRLHYWSKEIRGSGRLLRILRNYQFRSAKEDRAERDTWDSSRGHLLGFIHGHNHADQIDYEETFPIISIGCNKCEYFEDKKPEGAITCKRVLGEVSQDLWDVLSISIQNRTLDFTRFGAGEDRQVSLKKDGTGSPEASRESLFRTRDRKEEQPMKKVITYGTFDLFHEGHYNILKRAKALGDYLIVGVTTEHFDEQRGKINIVDSLLERIENVRSTGLVDEIIIEDHEGQKIEDVQKYGVDIFTLGSDWKGAFDYLKSYCQVVYLERTPDISSTMLRKGKFPIIRMGVVGTGRIAPRFIEEAKYVSGLNVQCVYNPHRESAESFAAHYFLDSYSEDFERFLDAVDAVYIASPHETHYDYTRRALLAGKHVLCEKPMAFSRSRTEELFSLARDRQLVLMEGIKTAYCPGFAQLIGIAKSGKIGEIRDVEACFSRLTAPNLREMVDTRYGGAFLEFGSYTVLPIVKLLGGQYKKIKISSILAENGIDLYTKIYFDYPEGMATSKTGVGVKSEGQLLISGTKGYILAESPWWLTRKFQVRYEDPDKIETYTPNFLGDGLRYEIGEFALRIHGRGGHFFKLTEEETLAMADVVECFMEERSRQKEAFRKKNREAGVRIWAHRGASYRYPENTLEAFRAACELPGLAGIELDIQLSKDGEIVVFHDETLDRLMDKTGNVRDYTFEELGKMGFKDWRAEELSEETAGTAESIRPRIPSMREVLELVKPYALKQGVQINIELKNSKVPYGGMEEKILSLIAEYGMEDYVVYSSFNKDSVKHLKELDRSVKTGILQSDIRDCLRLASEVQADALHPNVSSVTEEWKAEQERGLSSPAVIRAWNSREPFYRQIRQYIIFDLAKLKQKGITDFITNVPEEYLEN